MNQNVEERNRGNLRYRIRLQRLIGWLAVAVFLAFTVPVMTGCGSSTQDYMESADQAAKEAAFPAEDVNEQGVTGAEPGNINRKIIQNVSMSLQVADVTVTMDKIGAMCKENGGYIVRSHLDRYDDRYNADITIKIPQGSLTPVITKLSNLGDLIDKTISTKDVTDEYYDSQARLKVMEAKEERLLALLGKADNISDIVAVENELGEVRSDIEVLKGRLKFLDNATSYSEISIYLEQSIPGKLAAPKGTLGKAGQGFINSINYMVSFAGNLFVFIIIILPWAAIISVLFFIVRYFIKRGKKFQQND